jgi:hypothetical protein
VQIGKRTVGSPPDAAVAARNYSDFILEFHILFAFCLEAESE